MRRYALLRPTNLNYISEWFLFITFTHVHRYQNVFALITVPFVKQTKEPILLSLVALSADVSIHFIQRMSVERACEHKPNNGLDKVGNLVASLSPRNPSDLPKQKGAEPVMMYARQ